MSACRSGGAAEHEREIFMRHVACEKNDREKSCTHVVCPADAEHFSGASGGRRGRIAGGERWVSARAETGNRRGNDCRGREEGFGGARGESQAGENRRGEVGDAGGEGDAAHRAGAPRCGTRLMPALLFRAVFPIAGFAPRFFFFARGVFGLRRNPGTCLASSIGYVRGGAETDSAPCRRRRRAARVSGLFRKKRGFRAGGGERESTWASSACPIPGFTFLSWAA